MRTFIPEKSMCVDLMEINEYLQLSTFAPELQRIIAS